MLRRPSFLSFFLSLLIPAFLCTQTFAQVGTMSQAQPVHMPNTAALAKYVEFPVSYYSGTPSISIPIYEINEKGMNLPISLSYQANGLKVKEIPGWVGAGFSLNAGGMITRVTKGYPDDHYPYMGMDYTDSVYKSRIRPNVDFFGEFTDLERYYFYTSVPNVVDAYKPPNFTRVDLETDVFYFNFCGKSGEFTFDNKKQILHLSGEDLHIEYKDRLFKITDAEGIEYYFRAVEQASDNWGSNVWEYSWYATSWYLTKMRAPVSGSEITFTYKTYRAHELYDFEGGKPQKVTYKWPLVMPSPWSHVGYAYDHSTQGDMISGDVPDGTTSSLFLDSIKWGTDKCITFQGGLTRQDAFKYKLDGMTIQCGADIIGKVEMNYGYFNQNSPNKSNKRLKLDNLIINDQQYRFGYYNSHHGLTLPPLYHGGHDTWGYYNGEDVHIPDYKILYDRNYIPYDVAFSYQGRSSTYNNPDWKYAQIGSLSYIEYPTGGRSEFTYEGNDYSNYSFRRDPNDKIEDDAFTQLIMDNGYAQVAGGSVPISEGPAEALDTRYFTVHEPQVANFTGKLGIRDDVTFEQYTELAVYKQMYSTVQLAKFNETTNDWEEYSSYIIYPFDIIGDPLTAYDYEAVKNQGILKINENITLPEGRYRINCEAWGYGSQASLGAGFIFNYKKTPYIYNAGGIRIKKITYTTGAGDNAPIVKNFEYTDGLYSTGVLESPFSNCYMGYEKGLKVWGDGYTAPTYPYIYATVDGIMPLGNAKGGVIGYGKVTEKRSDNSKTVYYYTTGLDVADGEFKEDIYLESVSFNRSRILLNNSWKRGLLKQVDYFNANNTLVQQEFKKYRYETGSDYATSIAFDEIDLGGYVGQQAGYGFPQFGAYYLNQVLLSQESSITYSNGNTLSIVKDYEYNPAKHFWPVKISTTQSDKSRLISYMKYPKDYTIGTGNTDDLSVSIRNLVQKNVISPVIEKYTQKTDATGNNTKTLSSELNVFKTNQPLPYQTQQLEIAAPVIDFTPLDISSPAIVKDARYRLVASVPSYDAKGNLTEIEEAGKPRRSYIWDYDDNYPVAIVENASLTDIAFTTFETSSAGNWTGINTANVQSGGGITGSKYYNQTGFNLSKSSLTPATEYTITYWSKNGAYSITGTQAGYPQTMKTVVAGTDTWTLYKHIVTGQSAVTVSGTGAIDELRLYPSKAQMSTYTYRPLVGIKSACTPNDQLSYYEYDNTGRLLRIRDEQQNILKENKYQYRSGTNN